MCAATSPAVKLYDETLTYLNQGWYAYVAGIATVKAAYDTNLKTRFVSYLEKMSLDILFTHLVLSMWHIHSYSLSLFCSHRLFHFFMFCVFPASSSFPQPLSKIKQT